MNAQNVKANSVDPEGKWFYRVSGIAAFVLVVAYFSTFPIYFRVGDPPASGVEAQLAYFAEHAGGWWAIVFLMVFTDLLIVPIFFGIYMALKHVNKGLIFMALAFKAFLFVILDLAVTWTAYSTMIIGGVQYGAAGTGAQGAALAGQISGLYRSRTALRACGWLGSSLVLCGGAAGLALSVAASGVVCTRRVPRHALP